MDIVNKHALTTARVEVVLGIVAISSFVLGVGDLIAGSFSVEYGSDPALSFSFVWAGVVFAVINGSLALRASCNKPQIDKKRATVSYRFGIATLVLHCIDLILAAVGVGMYAYTWWYSYYTGYYYNSIFVLEAAALPEAVRLVIVACLVALDSLQIHYTKKFVHLPTAQHVTPGLQTVQVMQTMQPGQAIQMQVPMTIAMPMTVQPGMTFANQPSQVIVYSPGANNTMYPANPASNAAAQVSRENMQPPVYLEEKY